MATGILLSALGILCFLFAFNLFMRGRSTEAVGGLLGILILLAAGFGFFFSGWRIGLLMVAMPFLLIPVFSAIAARILRR